MVLIPAFFVTACLYAMVGFGGGSTYNALLALADTDYRIMPVVALVCNLIVVTGGTWRFARSGHLELRRAAPWVAASVPAALVGGALHVSERFFIGVLGLALLLAALHIIFLPPSPADAASKGVAATGWLVPLAAGLPLGFLAGLVGIGGGIFLAPLLYLLRWGDARIIAANCCFFILVNSVAGLLGQATKLDDPAILTSVTAYWPLFPAVLVGGQIGSYLGAARINRKWLRVMTALLIVYVSVRLLWRWHGMESKRR